MAEIIKEIECPSRDLVLEVLKYQKHESPRNKKAIIHFETGFDFDKSFTPEELEELGWWLIHQAQSFKKKKQLVK